MKVSWYMNSAPSVKCWKRICGDSMRDVSSLALMRPSHGVRWGEGDLELGFVLLQHFWDFVGHGGPADSPQGPSGPRAPPFLAPTIEIEILATFVVDFRRKKKYGEDLAMGLLWVSNQVI